MRSDLLVWTIRGIGLAIGVALVAGALVIAGRASDVILLVFLALLLPAGDRAAARRGRERKPRHHFGPRLDRHAPRDRVLLARRTRPPAAVRAQLRPGTESAGLAPGVERDRDPTRALGPRPADAD